MFYNKYKNKKITNIYGTFDSKLEALHYDRLLLLERAKKIKNLIRQVRIKLGKNEKCKIAYVADFVFYDLEKSEWVVADSKGIETDTFKVKKAWLLDNYFNFRFEVIYRNKTETYTPFNSCGIDFDFFIKNYKKTLDKIKIIC